MSLRHVVTNLQPGEFYNVTLNGSAIASCVSTAGGVITFDSATGGTIAVAQAPAFSDPPRVTAYGKFTYLSTPVDGETLIQPVGLRLIGTGFDPEAPPTSMDFYIADADGSNPVLLGNVPASTTDADGVTGEDAHEFHLHLSNQTITAGDHIFWCRSHDIHGLAIDSPVKHITVIAQPSYTVPNTHVLTSDLDMSSNATYVGSSGSRVLIDGQGLWKITGNPSSIDLEYVDFINVGVTNQTGIHLTTNGATTIKNCRFFGCTSGQITSNSTGVQTIQNNLFASNSRFYLGHVPELLFGSQYCWVFDGSGTASGTNLFQGNNCAAGAFQFKTANWKIGDKTSEAAANIFIGPRIGIQIASSFSGSIERNYSQTDYPAYWSQLSNFEMGSLSGVTVEHNFIYGSSWPVRGISGEFRYNFIFGTGFVEGLLWTALPAGGNAPDVHHNLLYTQQCSRGVVYQVYSLTGTTQFRNNTVHTPNPLDGPPRGFIEVDAGAMNLNSNLLIQSQDPAVSVSGGSITADYNCFMNPEGVHYSPAITPPTHDVTGSAGLGPVYSNNTPQWDVEAVWKRTFTVASVLADGRTRYTPTTLVIDAGDTATYGAGNDIGCVGAGTANADDLFGTLT